MSFNRSKKHLFLVAIASAGLLFAGCQKKGEVASDKQTESTSSIQTSVAQPSSNAVYLAVDKSDLDAAARATLDANAAWLNANSGKKVTIEGNCDERGSREYNLALGQRRADAVRDFLTARGVSADRIDTVSFGEERPACKGSGEACWAQNRRGDIVTR